MQIRTAAPADREEIERLLGEAGLTTAGMSAHLDGFAVAEEAGRIIGSAGLEVYADVALLRSVAVKPRHRGRGIARSLVHRLLDRAAAGGVREIYLLTTTAADYFRRFGFEAIPRQAVAPGVLASAEFADTRCATAQAMHLRVGGGPAR